MKTGSRPAQHPPDSPMLRSRRAQVADRSTSGQRRIALCYRRHWQR